MTTRSAKKHKQKLDEEDWACGYITTKEKDKADDAAFCLGLPSSKQDIDADYLHDFCLRVCS